MNALYAAVVLAGGLSSRMKQFKPLLPLGGETATDHVISTFFSAGVDVVLVAGFRHEDTKAGIKSQGITFIVNTDYEKGMLSSVQTGIRNLKPSYRAFFIMPADIPLVRPETIKRLMAAADQNPQKIIYPVFKVKRGHPPLIPVVLIPAILEWRKGGGLKAILDTQEKLALEVPVPDGNIHLDMDTTEDYQKIQERYRQYELPTDEECREILTMCHVAPDRARHCYKVAEAAVAIARALNTAGVKVDLEIVRAAATLHDIAKGQRQHDISGGKLLREMGFGEVGDIVAVHSTLADDNTGLPMEAKAVYLADKLIGGEKLVSLEERYDHPDWEPEIRKFAIERLKVAQRVKRELESILGRTLEDIIRA